MMRSHYDTYPILTNLLLQDLNDLIFLFYEKSKEIKKSDSNTSTKKIRLHSNTHKNTIKKQYKD